ncbi:aldo/keto reductase [soil metagenome]
MMNLQFRNRLYNRRKMLGKSIKAGASLFFSSSVIPGFSKEGNSDKVMENQLITRAIPSTGEVIPAIGMGTWQTFDAGNSTSKKENLQEVLRLFVEMGGKLIDSSPMYGSSEEVVGDLARNLNIHNSLFIATKVWTRGEENGKNQMRESMELLKADTIDLMQVHNLLDYQKHLKTIRNMKEQGKVRYIGITHYTTGSYPELIRVMKENPVDFVQFNFSLQTREAENSILPFARDNGVAVIINRPFEGGSLFSQVKGKDLPEWAKELDINSWGQFFLKYIISHPGVTCAIPATDKPKHLEDNMSACYGKLPDEGQRKKMVDIFKNL